MSWGMTAINELGRDTPWVCRKKQENEMKHCPNPGCGLLHNHNNTCCSAECFKEHKEYLKGIKC